MTTVALIVAALLTAWLGVAHSWLGERRLLGPLLAPGRRQGFLEKSAAARTTLRFAWHLTSMAWCGIALILAALAFSPLGGGGRLVLVIIAMTFVLTGAVVLATSRGRHFAWPVFLLIAALAVSPLLHLVP